jgi:hypothetical protein
MTARGRNAAPSVLIMMLLVACGRGGEDSANDGSSTIAATAGAAPSTERREPSGPVPEAAGVEVLVAAARSVLGPTDDLVASLAPFATLPEDISTPENAEVVAFSLEHRNDVNGNRFRAGVTFDSSGTSADIVTFYDATLTAAGYTAVRSGERSDMGRPVRFVSFAGPDVGESLTVTVPDASGPSWTELDLGPYVDAESPLGFVERLGAWPGEIPGARAARAWGASIGTLPRDAGEPDVLALTVNYEVTGTTPEDLHGAILDALPTDAYRLTDAGTAQDEDGWTSLERDGFERVSFKVTDTSERGTVSLHVTGRVAL